MKRMTMNDKEAILRIAGAREGLYLICVMNEGEAIFALFGFILNAAKDDSEESEEITLCIALDDFCAETLRNQLILKTFERFTRLSY